MMLASSSIRPLGFCRTCHRNLSTSAVVAVKRPQKPFAAPLATIDAWGRRIPPSSESWDDERAAKAEIARRNLLDTLAENRGKSTLEKYGSRNGYGLKLKSSRQNQDPDKGGENAEAGAGHHDMQGGGAWAREAQRGRGRGTGGFGMKARDQGENWKAQVGARGRGKNRFQSAEEMFREQARLLNPSASASASASTFAGSKDKKRGANNVPYNNYSFRNASDEDVELGYEDNSSRSRSRSDSNDDRTKSSSRSRPTPHQPPHLDNDKTPLRFGPWANSNSERSNINNHSRVRVRDRDDEQPKQRKSFGLSSSVGQQQRTEINDRPTVPTTPTPEHPPPNESPPSPSSTSANHWQPTKKLTYSAMAGLKALHAIEPETYTRQVLSKRFGISVEAVSRIIKSKFRNGQTAKFDSLPDGAGAGAEWSLGEETGLDVHVQHEKPSLKGTKWDRDPGTSDNVSPVPAIMRAYQARRS